MDKFRCDRGRIRRNPERATHLEDRKFPDQYLMTRLIWKDAVNNLINQIEEERAKIGPLTCGALADQQVIEATREMERLINDYLRLKLAGRRRGYDDPLWF